MLAGEACNHKQPAMTKSKKKRLSKARRVNRLLASQKSKPVPRKSRGPALKPKRKSNRKKARGPGRGPGTGAMAGACAGIIAYILDPATNRNSQYKRIPRSGNSMATATCTPIDKVEMDWQNTTIAPSMLNANRELVIMRRDINCGSIVFYQNKGLTDTGYTYEYDLYGRNADDSNSTQANPSKIFKMFIGSDTKPVPLAYGIPTTSTTVFKPHGDLWAAGRLCKDAVSAMRWFYVAPDGNIDFGINNTSATALNCLVELHRWTPQFGDEVVADEIQLIASGASFAFGWTFTLTSQAPIGGYYSFAVGAVDGTLLSPQLTTVLDPVAKSKLLRQHYLQNRGKNLYNRPGHLRMPGVNVGYIVECSSQISGSKSVFGHRNVSGFEKAPGSFELTSVLASTAWFLNTGADAFKDGSTYSQQVPATEHWLQVCGDIENYIKNPRSVQEYAKDGFFSSLKPNSLESFDFRDVHRASNSTLLDNYWLIDGPDDYIMTLCDVVPSTQGVAQKGTWILAHGVEYTTNDPSREVEICTVPLSVMNKVMDVLRLSPQFHKNALHMKQIAEFARKGLSIARGVLKYGNMVSGALGAMGV